MILTPNQIAFLAMLRTSEGPARAPNPWAVTFGWAFTISDFSDHPHALGWPGFPYHGLMETAAGAYQINYPTWLDLQKVDPEPDFSRMSQDNSAIKLIRRADALDLLDAGQIDAVIAKCSGTWASLPGSTSGQPQAQMAALIGAYANAGGAFA